MEEKTDNVDILERLEFFEPDDLVECAMYRECIEGVRTLIAENKELKESNVELATTIDCLQTDLKEIKEEYSAEQKYEMKNTIPKSKVEEILNKYKYTEIGDSEKIIQFYKELQSLLGKE